MVRFLKEGWVFLLGSFYLILGAGLEWGAPGALLSSGAVLLLAAREINE